MSAAYTGCFLRTAAPLNPSCTPSRILSWPSSDLRADAQLLRLLIEQQDGHIPQMEIVAGNLQDALQHLIQIEGGEHSLARFVQDRDFLHDRGNCRREKAGYRGAR